MTELRYSKKAINRAGEILVDDPQNEEALEVLDYWRAIHAEMAGVEQNTEDHFSIGAISVKESFRLKRTVSVIEKLRRYPAMRLSRMQDIAGMRFVVETASAAALGAFRDYIIRFQKAFSSNHALKQTNDYTEHPKPSGYRAVHLIYEHQNDLRPLFNGLLLEIQFRTRLQHLWAMAVETVGMFYGQALKASQGDPGWLDFFRLASAAISYLENAPVVAGHAEKSYDEIRRELNREGTEKSFFSKLAAIKEVDEQYSTEEYDYWLLEVNIKKGKNAIYGFTADQIETAHEMYAAKEQTPACLRGDSQVVLVSTQSFKDLREAYPSYFLDVADFIKTLHDICDN